MRRVISTLTTALLIASAAPAFAWGGDGHRAVGKIASLRVKPSTAERIAKILKPGESLASISTWADSVKERVGETDPDPDTHAFLQDIAQNEKNREWHYDDLPLGCESYQTCTGFTLPNDVVHLINISIRTLQGHPDPKQPLSKRNALRLLVHLVGDMHQPLHIGSGFIDENGPGNAIVIATNPSFIRKRKLDHDEGGNRLIIDQKRKKLHSYWDFDLVRLLMTNTNQPNGEALGNLLFQSIKPQSNWTVSGPINSWAAKWATDSLNQSRNHTYRGIRIIGKREMVILHNDQPVMKDGKALTEIVYDVTRPSNYESLNLEVARKQIAKAGFRLAKLLDAIFAN